VVYRARAGTASKDLDRGEWCMQPCNQLGRRDATSALGADLSPCLLIWSLQVFDASLYDTTLSVDISFLMQSSVFTTS
jgi:hypothetical protein